MLSHAGTVVALAGRSKNITHTHIHHVDLIKKLDGFKFFLTAARSFDHYVILLALA